MYGGGRVRVGAGSEATKLASVGLHTDGERHSSTGARIAQCAFAHISPRISIKKAQQIAVLNFVGGLSKTSVEQFLLYLKIDHFKRIYNYC